MLLDLAFIAGGLVLLYVGAEALVRGAATLAVRIGLSPLLVGLTVVAFGTSAPELVVSVEATLSNHGGIAVGNVVGSNIANIGLILGVASLIRPLRVELQLIRLDIPLMIGASALLTALLWDGALGQVEGLVLVSGVVAYVVFSIRTARRKRGALPPELVENIPKPEGSALRDALFVAAGLAMLVLGGSGLVEGAVGVAEAVGLSPTVIGLTVVAVGTSLPELATSTVASLRGAGDIAIGNVVGSNLFNLLGILGVAAVVRPLAAPGLDPVVLGVMLVSALVMLPLAWSQHALNRREGAILLALYGAYVYFVLA